MQSSRQPVKSPPTDKQQSLFLSTPKTATKPVLSVIPSTSSSQPVSTSASAESESSTPKIDAETEKLITKMIRDECALLELEMKAIMHKAHGLKIDLGSDAESISLVKSVESFEGFLEEVAETSNGQASEVRHGKTYLLLVVLNVCFQIHTLKQKLLQSWAWFEDARSRFAVSKDPEMAALIRTQPLDPASQQHLEDITHLLYYIESQLVQANNTLDEQWENFQDSCKKIYRMQMPTMETIYQAMVRQTATLQKQTYIVKDFATRLKKQNHEKSSAALTVSLKNADDVVEKLKELQLHPQHQMQIEYERVLKKQKQLGEKKIEKLRDFLAERKPVKVKVIHPQVTPSKVAEQVSILRAGLSPVAPKPKESVVRALDFMQSTPKPSPALPPTTPPSTPLSGVKHEPFEFTKPTSIFSVLKLNASVAETKPSVGLLGSAFAATTQSFPLIASSAKPATVTVTQKVTTVSSDIPKAFMFQQPTTIPSFTTDVSAKADAVTTKVSSSFVPPSTTTDSGKFLFSTVLAKPTVTTATTSSNFTFSMSSLPTTQMSFFGSTVKPLVSSPAIIKPTAKAAIPPSTSSFTVNLTSQPNDNMKNFCFFPNNQTSTTTTSAQGSLFTKPIFSSQPLFGSKPINFGATERTETSGSSSQTSIFSFTSVTATSKPSPLFSTTVAATTMTVTTTVASTTGTDVKAPVVTTSTSSSQSDAPVVSPAVVTTTITVSSPLVTSKSVPAVVSSVSSVTTGVASTVNSLISEAQPVNALPQFNLFTPVSTSVTTQPTVFGSLTTSPATQSVRVSVSSPSLNVTTQPSAFGNISVPSVTTTSPTLFGAVTVTTQSSTFTTVSPVVSLSQPSVFTAQPTVFTPSTAAVAAATSVVTTAASIFGATQYSIFSPLTAAAAVTTLAVTTATSLFGATQPSVFSSSTESVAVTTSAVTTAASIFTSTTGSIFGAASAPTTVKSVFGSPTIITSASIFGTPSTSVAGSVFGGTPAFGASPFGQKTTTPSFGSPSVFASTASAFGNANTPTTTAAFVQPSAFGSGSLFGTPASSSGSIFGGTQSGFGSNAFNQTGAKPPAFGTAVSSASGFGSAVSTTPSFGSTSQMNTFSFATAAANVPSSSSAFGFNKPAFGGGDKSSFSFGSLNMGTTTTASTGFGSGFGQTQAQNPFSRTDVSKPTFGSSSGSIFGSPAATTAGTAFGSGSTFGSPTFGGAPAFGSAPTFGQSTFGQSTFGASTFGSPSQSTGPFSGGGQTVGQTGFGGGSFQSSPGGFGGPPVFGSSPGAFGKAPSFGGAPAFGSSPTFGTPGKTFGSSTVGSGSFFICMVLCLKM